LVDINQLSVLVTLRQLQSVILVANCGSFSKASETCSAEQSTLCLQVNTKEEKQGLQLLIRDSIPILTTTDIKINVEPAKPINN